MRALDRGAARAVRYRLREFFAQASWVILAAAAMLAMSAAAQAQIRGGHDHGAAAPQERGARDSAKHGGPGRLIAEPFAALERELPSLQADLRLTPEQVQAWRSFERGVRAVAEINREQQRRLMALDGDSGNQMSAAALLAWLAEKAHARAQAAGGVQRQFDALHDSLDDEQRRMLDRRVMQSQTDPLGS